MSSHVGVLAQQGTHICERTRGDDPGRVRWLRHNGLVHGLDGWLGQRLTLRFGEEIGTVEAGFAVNVGCMNGRAFQGLGRAAVQRNLFVLANSCEDRGGIIGGVAVLARGCQYNVGRSFVVGETAVS